MTEQFFSIPEGANVFIKFIWKITTNNAVGTKVYIHSTSSTAIIVFDDPVYIDMGYLARNFYDWEIRLEITMVNLRSMSRISRLLEKLILEQATLNCRCKKHSTIKSIPVNFNDLP